MWSQPFSRELKALNSNNESDKAFCVRFCRSTRGVEQIPLPTGLSISSRAGQNFHCPATPFNYFSGICINLADTRPAATRVLSRSGERNLGTRLRVSRAREFARSFGCRRDYSQSMKEMEYVSREGYLQAELLAELIAPGFLKQTIYVDINFLLFSPSLLLLLSIMASCLETFEVQVMHLCLLTVFNLVPRVSLLGLP